LSSHGMGFRHTQGAFVLTADGKRDQMGRSAVRTSGLGDVSRKGSPAGSGSPVCVANQRMVRADHTALRRWRKDVAPAGNTAGRTASARASEGREQQVVYDASAETGKPLTTHQFYDGTQHPWEFKRCGIWSHRSTIPIRFTPGGRRRHLSLDGRRGELEGAPRPARTWHGPQMAAGRGRHVPAHPSFLIRVILQRMWIAISGGRSLFATDDGGKSWKTDQSRTALANISRTPMRRSATAFTTSR